MVWPGVSDYQEAVQVPKSCFKDGELAAGSPVLTKLGLPRPISGGNASVYQIRSGRSEYAVRCFLRDVPDLRQRYAAIDQHLRGVKLRSKVGFEFLTEGIRVRGHWHPVLKMEWIRGQALNEHLAAIRTDAAGLRGLAGAWRALQLELERAAIAHGDLQHGNVMVRDGELMLIDYDGMFVPALAGRPGLELGHPSYQHPQREAKDFGPAIDRFASLVIYAAMLALAEHPDLWATYDNGDNLLFTRDDFSSPGSSALFAALARSRDPALVAVVSALQQACKLPLAQCPRLEDVLTAAAKPRPAAVPTKAKVAAPASAAQSKPKLPSQRGGPRRPDWLVSLMQSGLGQAMQSAMSASGLGPQPQWRRERSAATSRVVEVSTLPPWARKTSFLVAAIGAHVGAFAIWPPAVVIAAAATVAVAARERAHRRRFGHGLTAPVGAQLALSRDGRVVASIAGGRVRLQAADTGDIIAHVGASCATLAVAAVSGGRFVTLLADGGIRLCDERGVTASTLSIGTAAVLAGAPGGAVLACAGGGHRIRIADIDGQDRGALAGHAGAVRGLAIARDQQRMCSVGDDGRVRIWSLVTRQCDHDVAAPASGVRALAISGNGRFVAIGAVDGTVAIIDGKRGKALHSLRLDGGAVTALAFAPDAAELFVGAADGAVLQFDAITGQRLQLVAQHPVAIIGLAVGEQSVATLDRDGCTAAWARRTATAPTVAKLQAARP